MVGDERIAARKEALAHMKVLSVLVLLLLAWPRAAFADGLPNEIHKEVMQLAGATGVLSSSSCRDGEMADRAASLLARFLRDLSARKFVSSAEERRFRTSMVLPAIKAGRGVSYSSDDCSRARRLVIEADS